MKLELVVPGDGTGEKDGDVAVLVLRPAGDAVGALGQNRDRVDVQRRRRFQAILKHAAGHRGQLRVELTATAIREL